MITNDSKRFYIKKENQRVCLNITMMHNERQKIAI